MRVGVIALSMLAVSACTSAQPSFSNTNNSDLIQVFEPTRTQLSHKPASGQAADTISFTFTAFGDAGFADSHVSRPVYRGGFRSAYNTFDPKLQLIGDINYINWETTVGNVCNAFWAPPSQSTYAFLTPPQELSDAVSIGFNLIGLANNHSFDCLRSPEGNGPLQTSGHITTLLKHVSSSPNSPLFSGAFSTTPASAATGTFRVTGGSVPVLFLSAYVGGDAQHCRNILCDSGLARYKKQMAASSGFRVLALHSWNAASHSKLKTILSAWLREGLVDVAIGSGPHVAESVSIVKTPRGNRVLATSLGNFIHPSLSSQPNNISLFSRWRYNTSSRTIEIESLKSVKISCRAETCKRGGMKTLL
jgi:hypothetical protein